MQGIPSTHVAYTSNLDPRSGVEFMMEAIRKCTLIPAQIVEKAAPQMRRKGRLQAGCDADIVVFDPQTLGDKATFAAMNQPAEGVRALLVNGVPVILSGRMQIDARPGRPVRGGTAP